MSAYEYIQHITEKGRTSVRLTVGRHTYLVDFDRWGEDWIGTVQKCGSLRAIPGGLVVSRDGISPSPGVAPSNVRLFERVGSTLERLADSRMKHISEAMRESVRADTKQDLSKRVFAAILRKGVDRVPKWLNRVLAETEAGGRAFCSVRSLTGDAIHLSYGLESECRNEPDPPTPAAALATLLDLLGVRFVD